MRSSLAAALLGSALVLAACHDTTAPVGQPDLATTTTHKRYYVSPGGSSGGDGSASRPWDLKTALTKSSKVLPGDTLWLRGGTYRGAFTSYLAGTSSAPIVVRRYPGERVTVDGNVVVGGQYVWFWGFEVINTNLSMASIEAFNVKAPGSRLINLVIHDASGNGVGSWAEAPNSQIYGSILYNNGRKGAAAGRAAHGIYAQNATGTKLLADNILFQTFGYGFHLYTEGSYLRNFTIDGNVAFNNGLRDGTSFMIGGGTPVQNLKFTGNMTYQSPGLGGGGVWLGRIGATNNTSVARDNYMVYGDPPFRIFSWSSLTVQNNTTVVGKGLMDEYGSWAGYSWNANRWYGTPTNLEIVWGSKGAMTYNTWRSTTKLGSTDSYISGRPTSARVFVRPNRYERGRANIIVYNWARQGSVPVNLSSVLTVGDRYEVRSAYAFYGTPVLSGTYGGGSVQLPIPATQPPRPLAGWPSTAPAASSAFGVFVVTRKGS